jgi:NADH dehydrogenase (ubiquinone) Fe-S protein 3
MKSSSLVIRELEGILPIYFTYKYINELSLYVAQKYIVLVATILKLHSTYQYKLLSCVSGIDLFNKQYRFCVAYDFLSILYNNRIRVKSLIESSTTAFSLTKIFCHADWWEREAWDMYGIFFFGHDDMRRILTDYGFEGYPLRKDFPLSGFVEVRYSEKKKKIVMEKVALAQEFRSFSFKMPW